MIAERTLKPRNGSPQGSFEWQRNEDFSAYATSLTPKEADTFQIVQLYRHRADAKNVFDELKNQWGAPIVCCHRVAWMPDLLLGANFTPVLFFKPRIDSFLRDTFLPYRKKLFRHLWINANFVHENQAFHEFHNPTTQNTRFGITPSTNGGSVGTGFGIPALGRTPPD